MIATTVGGGGVKYRKRAFVKWFFKQKAQRVVKATDLTDLSFDFKFQRVNCHHSVTNRLTCHFELYLIHCTE
jgi:hypothetical protein